MRRLQVASTLYLALLLVAVALSARADWDQDRVVDLASELEATLDLALESAASAAQQRTAMQQRTRDAAVSEMRRARDLSREYASKIRGGWSRGDSEPFFSQLRRATRHARETARDAVPDPKVAPYLARMDALLIELSQQYEAN